MSKAIRMAKLSAKGGFILFPGITLSTIISAISTIPVVRLLDPPQYRPYTITLITPRLHQPIPRLENKLRPNLVATLATKMKAKRLILTHIYPECQEREEEMHQETRNHYTGEVIFAECKMGIKV